MSCSTCCAITDACRNWRPSSATPNGSSSKARRLGNGVSEFLASACWAAMLALLGFDVAGWSNGPKQIPKVKSFTGEDGLAEILARSEIVVCLLPLTSATTGILNAHRFARMPQGSFLINAARGGHVVEGDLLSALDSGQVGHATLDVVSE